MNVVGFSIAATFENALSAGFIQATDYVEIWQVYLDYLRRRVDFRQGRVWTSSELNLVVMSPHLPPVCVCVWPQMSFGFCFLGAIH